MTNNKLNNAENQTLIILGNGFDLDLGWKTSYDAFYHNTPWYKTACNFPFVKEMIVGKRWYDFENYLLECLSELHTLSNEQIDNINKFWYLSRDSLAYYLSNNEIYTTNKESNAYHLLLQIKLSQIASFNYTNPFAKTEISEHEILYLHGSLENAESKAEIKFGVNTGVFERTKLIKKEERLRVMVKAYGSKYIDKFHSLLKMSKNIIIYGHSLGITDSDYFEPFFKAIINGSIKNKTIYIVTYDVKSLQQIKDNMLDYGIKYADLFFSNVTFIPVFTSMGIGQDNTVFHTMLNSIDL